MNKGKGKKGSSNWVIVPVSSESEKDDVGPGPSSSLVQWNWALLISPAKAQLESSHLSPHPPEV